MADITFSKRRETAFSYQCNRCNRCCYDKYIPTSPYDLIRLADGLGISTGELIERYTNNGILLLRREEEEGAPCVFLGPGGCTVHQDRPFVCRIYPLGKTILGNGTEVFGELNPHPETAGVYATDGTVGGYSDAQGCGRYDAATAEYAAFFMELDALVETVEEEGDDFSELPEETHLLDVDRWIADYCESTGEGIPQTPEDKVTVHLKAMRAWLEGFR
jgi:uncharacterized protein